MGIIKSSKKQLIYLFVLTALIIGCSGKEISNPEIKRPVAKEKIDLSSSLKEAYRLEELLWKKSDPPINYKEVLQHYSKGFGEKLATRLANYSWSNEMESLRPGDRVMWIPEKIYTISVNTSFARLYHKTPSPLIQAWSRETYTLVKMQKVKGRWLVIGIEYSNQKPD